MSRQAKKRPYVKLRVYRNSYLDIPIDEIDYYDDEGREIICCVCGACYNRKDVEDNIVGYDGDGERYICNGRCSNFMVI